jgi:hypothetical protein
VRDQQRPSTGVEERLGQPPTVRRRPGCRRRRRYCTPTIRFNRR